MLQLGPQELRIDSMELISYLATYLSPSYPAFISITGGGGKTTSLALLGQYFRHQGLSVLMTTTTKIQSPKGFKYDADVVFTSEEEVLAHTPVKGELVFYAERSLMDPKKVSAPRINVLEILSRRYDVVVSEADGARCLPLKIHTDRDPVVPSFTTATLAIMGASAFGEKADNVCFGYEGEERVDEDFFQKLIDMEEGTLKRSAGNTLILINQCDAIKKEYLEKLRSLEACCPILLGSLVRDERYV